MPARSRRATACVHRRQRGATSVEYAMIASLIAGVIGLSVAALGQAVIGLFQSLVWP